MKNYIFIILLLSFGHLFAQTETQILQEAANRNITSKAAALEALAAEGITEAQARQLARMRGIDFDTFVATYFQGETDVAAGTIPTLSPVTADLVVEAPPLTTTTATIDSSVNSETLYFGYEIFQQNPFREKEYLVGNIDEGYVIAPGDVLRIIVFGNNSLEFEAEVDLNGNINIPKYGVFQVAGNRFKSLKQRLKTYLGKYFSGLLSESQNTFIDVSLTQIRPVKVSVLGQVSAPGPHLVNGLASVLNALYAAGGIKESGSLREIYVYRNNRKIRTVDVYDYITTGRIKNDVRLSSNDVIFVPNRLSSVALEGTVKNEKVYELKKGEGINDLLTFSGGLMPTADIQKINIARITPFENRVATQQFDRFLTTVNYASLQANKENFVLEDGDKVTLFPILARVEKSVTVTGSVNVPGTYSLETFSTLKQLILSAAKGLAKDTYLGKVDVLKEDREGKKRFMTYNLQAVINGDVAAILEDGDQVRVYSLNEVAGEKTVRVSGYGVVQGEEEKLIFWRENLSPFDVIFEATSYETLEFQRQLLTSRVDVKRYNPEIKMFENIRLSLDKLSALKDFRLQPQDEVILYSRSVTERTNPFVAVVGFVQQPDTLGLEKNMLVEDAILKAGGFKDSADKTTVFINRENINAASGQLSKRITYSIDQNYLLGLNEAPSNPFYLEDKDIISVRKAEGYQGQKTISINGAVRFPGTVVAEYELETFNDLIESVGGLKKQANLNASYVIRDGKPLSINLSKQKGKAFLINGDQIFIAENSGTVETLGGVENEALFIWESGKRAKYYIRNSGGKVANEGGKAYLVLPNGKSKRIGFLRNPKVYPNAQIVVNRKLQKEKVEGKFLDDFTRIFGLLTGTLTTILLTQRL